MDITLHKDDGWREGYKRRFRKRIEAAIRGFCQVGKPGQLQEDPLFKHSTKEYIFLGFHTVSDADCALRALRCIGGLDTGVPENCENTHCHFLLSPIFTPDRLIIKQKKTPSMGPRMMKTLESQVTG